MNFTMLFKDKLAKTFYKILLTEISSLSEIRGFKLSTNPKVNFKKLEYQYSNSSDDLEDNEFLYSGEEVECRINGGISFLIVHGKNSSRNVNCAFSVNSTVQYDHSEKIFNVVKMENISFSQPKNGGFFLG